MMFSIKSKLIEELGGKFWLKFHYIRCLFLNLTFHHFLCCSVTGVMSFWESSCKFGLTRVAWKSILFLISYLMKLWMYVFYQVGVYKFSRKNIGLISPFLCNVVLFKAGVRWIQLGFLVLFNPLSPTLWSLGRLLSILSGVAGSVLRVFVAVMNTQLVSFRANPRKLVNTEYKPIRVWPDAI